MRPASRCIMYLKSRFTWKFSFSFISVLHSIICWERLLFPWLHRATSLPRNRLSDGQLVLEKSPLWRYDLIIRCSISCVSPGSCDHILMMYILPHRLYDASPLTSNDAESAAQLAVQTLNEIQVCTLRDELFWPISILPNLHNCSIIGVYS